ncbi:MAG: lamin tail domain-containing protein [Bacteroidota bacterium]
MSLRKLIWQVFLVVLISLPAATFAQQLQIHFINVGWGASMFIKGPNGTTLLIEAGNTGKGSGKVVPYLQSIGILPANGFDYTIVGHQHSDHLGGMDEVINAGYDVHIRNYYNGSSYSTTAATQWNSAAASTTAGAPVVMPVGQIIDLGNGAKITCVARNGSIIGGGSVSVSDENDRSIALLIQYNGFDMLWASDMGGGSIDQSCTGRSTSQVDVETSVINAISPGGASPLISAGGIDVLFANHHGSESSTNMNYMNKSAPSVAVINTGDGQTSGWDLPRIDVVEHVLLAQATSCITVPPAVVLQTEEGSPAGSLTSTAGFCVGDITVTTSGTGTFTVSADGAVTEGPNEVAASGLPFTLPTDDSPGDVTPPVISNVQASTITEGSATITWSTDEASTSIVEYGLTASYGSNASNSSLLTGHSIDLTGLSANTLYHYRVSSTDAASNTATSGDFTFTTSAPSDVTPPVISNIQSTNITASSADIAWATDENSNSVVEYGLTTSYGSSASDATMVASHAVSLGGLTSNTVYHYRVRSTDGANNTATSGDNTFTTAAGSPTHVVMSEILYDTPGTDSQEEWVELYNQTGTDADISGWTITDDNGFGTTYTVPAGTTIHANTYFTIAVNQAGFLALYGHDADLYGGIPALNNTGETLLLKNSAGQVIDAVAWEGGATNGIPAGWGSTTLPTAPTGSTIVRSDAHVDSDTYADWTTAANNGNPQTQMVTSDYAPTSTTVSVGTQGSGTYTNLATNNASYYNVNSTTSGTRTSDWYATTTIAESPSSVSGLTVTYDGKQSKSGITQKVYLFNYSTSAWNQIDSRTVSTSDVTITYSPATPGNYISVTGLIRVRVLSTSTSKSFTTNADYVHYAVQAYAPPSSPSKGSETELLKPKALPEGYSLGQNYPNPFNPTTIIPFELKDQARVRLSVFDLTGREVAVLADGELAAGSHTVEFNPGNLPSGSYLYRMTTPSFTVTRKLTLLK